MTITGLKNALDQRGAPIALATLSYWRSASRQPDAEKQRHIIAEAEEVLGLEPGRLASLAARPWVLRKPLEPLMEFLDLDEEGEALLTEAMRALEVTPTEHLRELSQLMTTDVGVDGFPRRSTIRTMMQCVEGVTRRVMWSVPMENGRADAVRFTVVHGRDGGRWLDPGHRLAAVAIDLDPPLHAGDTTMLEVQVDYLDGVETEMTTGIFENRVAQKLVNWVRFHPDGVPDWFVESEVRLEGERRRLRGLDTATSIHQVRWNFGPGSVNLAWGYGDPPDLSEETGRGEHPAGSARP
ncbi:MAG: hypothetical protein WA971_05140 [Microbacterium sp.]